MGEAQEVGGFLLREAVDEEEIDKFLEAGLEAFGQLVEADEFLQRGQGLLGGLVIAGPGAFCLVGGAGPVWAVDLLLAESQACA